MSAALTIAEVMDLPAATGLVTAGRALGIGRTRCYELARAGMFPCPVIRAGKTYLVPTAGLLAVLKLPLPGPAGAQASPGQQVTGQSWAGEPPGQP